MEFTGSLGSGGVALQKVDGNEDIVLFQALEILHV
jgi:hypothetical protein